MDRTMYVIRGGAIIELNAKQCREFISGYAKHITDKRGTRRVDHLIEGFRVDVVFEDEALGLEYLSFLNETEARAFCERMNAVDGNPKLKMVPRTTYRIAHWLPGGKRKVDKEEFTDKKMAETLLDLYARFDFEHNPGAPRLFYDREDAESALGITIQEHA